jgi:hypothetical protein
MYTAAGVVGDKGHDDGLKDLRHGLFRVSQTSPSTNGACDSITSDVVPQIDCFHSGIVCREVRTHLQCFRISHLISTMKEYYFKKNMEKLFTFPLICQPENAGYVIKVRKN